MKRKQASNLLPKVSALAVALVFSSALPTLAATKTVKPAKSTKAMQQRIDELESQVKRLEELVTKVADKADAVATKADAADAKASVATAKTDQVAAKTLAVEAKADAAMAAADNDEERSEFNRVKVKVEALEDSKESAGFMGLKISGMIDPTYIYNRARDSAGFNFLSNFSDVGTGKDVYAYDNSYFGQARLQFDKELESGSKFKLVLAPHKSGGSLYNAGSIVHEASVSIPIAGPNTRLLAGQIPDWSGYEYYFGDQNKLITHNILFDFTLPTTYTGAGLEVIRGNLDVKALVANMNKASRDDHEKSQMFLARFDYGRGEFSGLGGALVHGKYIQKELDTVELDGYFIRGPWTLDGQVAYGQWKNAAFNGGKAQWWGLSGLAAYKFTPVLEGIARFDYLNNDKNGGGTFATALNCLQTSDNAIATCDQTKIDNGEQINGGDYRSGFGPSQADAIAFANGSLSNISGANRSALSLGLDYSLYTNTMIKAEFRYDYADQPVFYYVRSGNFKDNNQVFGLSTVLSF